MKPRNKTERLVAELSAKLPAITEKQKQWAKDTCFEKIGYYSKGEVWCMSCGRVHEKAAYKMGLDFYATEIDKQYFDAQEKRFKNECLGEIITPKGVLVQLTLFDL